VAAIAISGLPVAYSSGKSQLCTNVSATFTMVSVTGVCVRSTTRRATRTTRPPASDHSTAATRQPDLTVTQPAPPSVVVNSKLHGGGDPSSVLAVVGNSGILSVLHECRRHVSRCKRDGTCVVQYDQPGNATTPGSTDPQLDHGNVHRVSRPCGNRRNNPPLRATHEEQFLDQGYR